MTGRTGGGTLRAALAGGLILWGVASASAQFLTSPQSSAPPSGSPGASLANPEPRLVPPAPIPNVVAPLPPPAQIAPRETALPQPAAPVPQLAPMVAPGQVALYLNAR